MFQYGQKARDIVRLAGYSCGLRRVESFDSVLQDEEASGRRGAAPQPLPNTQCAATSQRSRRRPSRAEPCADVGCLTVRLGTPRSRALVDRRDKAYRTQSM